MLAAAWPGFAAAHEEHRRAEVETAPVEEATPGSETALPAAEPPPPRRAAPQPRASAPPVGPVRLLAWLGKLHPTSVHFPIALLLCAGAAEALWSSRRAPLLAPAGRFCVWAGALGALIAAPLGWSFAAFSDTEQGWVLTTHRWLGTGLAVWAPVLVGLLERAERGGSRGAYRAALLLAAVLVVSTGFFGGSLVYGLDHFRW